jgi:CRP-like cAMP-binding protein
VPSDGVKGRAQRALKLCALFEKCGRSTRDAAIAAAEVDVVPGGVVIIEQGSGSDALLVVGRGRVRVERTTTDGQIVPLGYRGSGDVVGEACLGRTRRHAESTTTMEEAEIVRIPARLVHEFMASDPALGPAVVALLIARQREIEERIESLLFRNVEGRLAEFLLKAAERWGVPSPKGVLISAPITHLEIAQSIGSTRETVTLTLGAMRKEGLLDVAGRRLIVKDRDALAMKQ